MNKKLLAFVLASLPFAASATGANVLFGKVGAGVNIKQELSTTRSSSNNAMSIASNTEVKLLDATVGVKGQQQISEDTNAVYQASVKLDAKNGAKTQRAYVGVSGQFGTLTAGKVASPLQEAASIGDAGKSGGMSNMFTSDSSDFGMSLRFDTPAMSGMRAAFQFSSNAKAFTAGFSYNGMGGFVKYGFGFKQQGNGSNGGNSQKTAAFRHHAEMGYKGFGATFTAGYRASSSNWNMSSTTAVTTTPAAPAAPAPAEKSSTNMKHEVAASASYEMDGVMPHVSYAHSLNIVNGSDSKDNNNKYHQVVAGVDYKVGKNTTALISTSWLSNGKQTVSGLVGFRHSF